MSTEAYLSQICYRYHGGPPLSYGFPATAPGLRIPEGQCRRRVAHSNRQYEIDSEYFFIVGNIGIPLIYEYAGMILHPQH